MSDSWASRVEQEIVYGFRSRRGVRAGGRRVAKSGHHGGGTIETRVVCVAVRRGDSARRRLAEILMRQGVSRRRVELVRTIDARRRKGAHRGFIRNRSFRTREQGGGKSQRVSNVYRNTTPLWRPPCKPPPRARSNPTTTPSSVPLTGTAAGKPTELIIFIIGGVCYRETKVCEQFNASRAGVSVVVGPVRRSPRAFIDDLLRAQNAVGGPTHEKTHVTTSAMAIASIRIHRRLRPPTPSAA